MPAETSLAMCSFMMGGVLEQCPSLRVMFAHGGGSFPGTLARIEHGWAARPDLCQAVASISPQQHCDQRHVWVDSLVHDAHALESIVRTFGAERVALGTDYPFPLGEFRADETAKVESGDSKYKIYDAGALVFSMAATKGEGWAEGGDLRTQLLSGAALSWLGTRATKDLKRPS
jgi:predicted TIM-barrel fold metal-dependent hydrolase